MGRRVRSSVQSSAEELLSSAVSEIYTKPGKSKIKILVWSVDPSSDLVSSLPTCLHFAISRALDSFNESIKPRTTDDASASGGGIGSFCSPPLKRFRRSSRLNRSNDPDSEAPPPDPGSEALDIQKKLRAYAYIAHLCVSHPKKLFCPSDILPSVRVLHDNLISYEDLSLLEEVASLCGEWWKEDFPGKKDLITQSLPFLLSKSLTRGKKTDVHRIYSLRDAFSFYDYDDACIEDLRLLLVRCAINPVYLKTKEGRNFIAFMVGLDGLLLKEVLELIRSQIPFAKKSVLEGFADILFKAWGESKDSAKEEIENIFLQGLIEGAIHASTKLLAASIRRVLSGFICQRTTPGVDKLIFRLTEPVLFRSLQVANSNVRQNALFLLLDLFPLEDPDVTKEVKDTLLEKQFFLLQKLLMDDCPEVRAVTVEGLCRILNMYWEVIPSLAITKTLGKVIDDMTCDMCKEVRLSTLNGIKYLLENPQSHEVMKVLLPRLGCMLSDPSLSVRVAFTDLLLEVGHIRSFQFNKIVSINSLICSLSEDHQSVARKITRLLIPSYFPSNVTPKEARNRFFALFRRSPIAGTRFCEFALSEGSSSKSLMELLRVSLGLALAPKGLKSDQIDGLIIASANICSCIQSELSNYALKELFSGDKLESLLSASNSFRAQSAVLDIASVVSPNDLDELLDPCMIFLIECSGLSDDLEKQGLIQKIHRLIFSCGWFSELFGMLTSILQTIAFGFLVKFGLDVPQQILQSLKKKIKLPKKISARVVVLTEKGLFKSDKIKTEKALGVAAGIAWQLKDLLADVAMRMALLQSPNLEVSFHSLNIISQVSIEQCVRYKIFDASPILALISLAVYCSLQKDDSAVNEVLKCDVKDGSQCMNSHAKCKILGNTLNNLLNCAEKIFNKAVFAESATPPSKMNNTEFSCQKSRRRAAASASNLTDPTYPPSKMKNTEFSCQKSRHRAAASASNLTDPTYPPSKMNNTEFSCQQSRHRAAASASNLTDPTYPPSKMKNTEFSCPKSRHRAAASASNLTDPTYPPSKMKNTEFSCQKSRHKAASSASNLTEGCDLKLDIPDAKVIKNVMKMCTCILRVIADTASIILIGKNDICFLRFASAYARYVISTMGGYRREVSFVNEDDLKETFEYVKISFTYAAKLLHLVLQHSREFLTVPVEAFYLSNDLLNLLSAIEPYFGLKHASQMVPVVKPWLPVLILGVGCNQLLRPRHQEGESNFMDLSQHHFPIWLAVLSEAELHQISNIGSEENSDQISEPEAPVFIKLICMVVAMLKKGSLKIMDAIGCVLLVGLDVGLHTEDFGLLLGLVHFICEKLLGKEFTSWNELEHMTSRLQDIYPRIENAIANPSLSEDERHKLEAAKELLTSSWMSRE